MALLAAASGPQGLAVQGKAVEKGHEHGFSRDPGRLAQGQPRIGAKFEDRQQHRKIEFLVGEGEVFGLTEVEVRHLTQPIPGGLQHGRRGVESGHVEAGPVEGFQKNTGPAADFQQPLSPARPIGRHAFEELDFPGQRELARRGLKPGIVAPGGIAIPHTATCPGAFATGPKTATQKNARAETIRFGPRVGFSET